MTQLHCLVFTVLTQSKSHHRFNISREVSPSLRVISWEVAVTEISLNPTASMGSGPHEKIKYEICIALWGLSIHEGEQIIQTLFWI